METSSITTKYQATVPADIKARPLDIALAAALSATLDEWDSAEDEAAWRDLYPGDVGVVQFPFTA